MVLFQPEFGLIFWMLVVFLIILGILAKYAWPVIIRSIEQRAEFIDSGVKSAEEARRQLEEARGKAEQLLAEAHRKQLESLQETERMRREMIEQAKKDAAAEVQKLIDEGRRNAERLRREAEAQVRQEVSVLALQVAEKVLRKDLASDAAQMELIGKMVEEMSYRVDES